MDNLIKNQIKGLLLKNFNKEEIAKLLKVEEKEVGEVMVVIGERDLTQNSADLYSELQKDLSKLVLTEMGKESRDTNVILSSIKLQADLQEKKLILNRKVGDTKISKDYIYNRDEEIAKLKKKEVSEKEIAKKFNISVLSVKQATDRSKLGLSENLKMMGPSIISETIGLDKKTRLKILSDAYDKNLKRKDVREIVNKIKNTR